MEHLVAHYLPKTIEIAERFKFFKRSQNKGEAAVDFIADLRRLAKTCNFGNYLETEIRDQFVSNCGLRDSKCQKELLCREGHTVDIALQSARAAEVVARKLKLCRTNNGIKPTEEQIKSIQKAPSPVNKQESVISWDDDIHCKISFILIARSSPPLFATEEKQ